MIQKNTDILKRSRLLKQGKRGPGPVVYWMQRDIRIDDNWALLFAQQEALVRKKPLVIVFFLAPLQPQVDQRHAALLYQSLAEAAQGAQLHNIGFHLSEEDLEKTLPLILEQWQSHLLVTDFLPLRHNKQRLHTTIIENINVPFVEVDSHNIVPAWISSAKKEYGAYTIRPKISRLLPEYLIEFPPLLQHPYTFDNIPSLQSHKLGNKSRQSLAKALSDTETTNSQAITSMHDFISSGLHDYTTRRNNPNCDGQSGLSPFLHYGQLSAQRLALEVNRSNAGEDEKNSFLEELIIRKELADNFCLYEPCYDKEAGFPQWAKKTLDEHRQDRRAFLYSLKQFENGETHEKLWNSCQFDLVKTGKLHGFLRMYWAKKILEWTSEAGEALEYAIYLNDKYSLDGCDPNGYAGIAWSIGGVHDRAWRERAVFGKIRYMNERGCRRKFNVDQYIDTHSSNRERQSTILSRSSPNI